MAGIIYRIGERPYISGTRRGKEVDTLLFLTGSTVQNHAPSGARRAAYTGQLPYERRQLIRTYIEGNCGKARVPLATSQMYSK